ncbi:MAG: hypothetical protein AAF639_39165 [Chloroflexota bacterium]
MGVKTGAIHRTARDKQRHARIHRQSNMLQPETDAPHSEFSLSRQPSEFLQRNPSSFLSRSHHRAETNHTETDKSNYSPHHQPTIHRSTEQPISSLSFLKSLRTSHDAPASKQGAWLNRYPTSGHTIRQPTINRRVSLPTSKLISNPSQKNHTDVIQLVRRNGTLQHPKGNGNQVTIYGYTTSNNNVTVKTQYWDRSSRQKLNHNTPISIDLDKRDTTQKYVEVQYVVGRTAIPN